MIRNQGLDPSVNEEDQQWVQQHRQNLQEFLNSIQDKKFSLELDDVLAKKYDQEMELRKEMMVVYDKFLKDVDETIECTLCEVGFEKKEFAIQHINLKHFSSVEKDIKVNVGGTLWCLENYWRGFFWLIQGW